MRERSHAYLHPSILLSSLPQATKVLYLVISYRCGDNGHTWASIARLGEDAGLMKNAATRHLRALEEAGLVKRAERRKDGARTHYFLRLTGPDEWTIPDTSKGDRETDPDHPKGDRPIPRKGIGRSLERGSAIYEDIEIEGKKDEGGVAADAAPSEFDFSPGSPIAEDFLTERFCTLWDCWVAKRMHRTAKRDRATPDTLDRARAKIAGWATVQDCMDLMLEDAAERGWLQLRTPKQMGKPWLGSDHEQKDEGSKVSTKPGIGF